MEIFTITLIDKIRLKYGIICISYIFRGEADERNWNRKTN
jgi:hypothetical protein